MEQAGTLGTCGACVGHPRAVHRLTAGADGVHGRTGSALLVLGLVLSSGLVLCLRSCQDLVGRVDAHAQLLGVDAPSALHSLLRSRGGGGPHGRPFTRGILLGVACGDSLCRTDVLLRLRLCSLRCLCSSHSSRSGRLCIHRGLRLCSRHGSSFNRSFVHSRLLSRGFSLGRDVSVPAPALGRFGGGGEGLFLLPAPHLVHSLARCSLLSLRQQAVHV
mmetsp:Transcript_18792/g.30161  ORF Transcript_18792/g.30161 Transcript_18792/m.30161 type:complete len:218 (-) Transcript_18792:723-1376(-)